MERKLSFDSRKETFDSTVDIKGKLLWLKPGFVNFMTLVGKNVIAYSCNLFITFFNVFNKTEIVYEANSPENGRGVQTLCGCRTLDIFAFSDKTLRSKIFVLRYPSFEKLCVITENVEVFYLDMALNETEHLLCLTGAPKFEIVLWSWRTGRKLSSKATIVSSKIQEIRFSPLSQSIAVQVAAKRTSNIIIFWEIFSIKKTCLLLRTDIKYDNNILISSYCFTPEGNIQIVDKSGNIYFMSKETHTIEPMIKHIHCQNEDQGKDLHYKIRWFKGGLLKTTKHSHVQHYKRTRSFEWIESWKIQTSSPAKYFLVSYMRDYVIIACRQGELWKVNSKSDQELLKYFGSKFEFAKLLNPMGDCVVAISGNELSAWKTNTGEYKGRLDIPDKALSFDCHPFKRVVGVGLVNGSIITVLVDKINFKPVILSKIFLCGHPLDGLFYLRDGLNFTAASFETGKVFVLKGLYGENTSVVGFIDLDLKLTAMKICYSDGDKSPKIILLKQSDDFNPYAGNELICYGTTLTFKGSVALNENIVDFEPHGDFFFVILQASMKLYILYCSFAEGTVLKFAKISSGHEVRKFNIFSNRFYSYTFGYDGMVVIYSAKTVNAVARLEALDYLDRGVKYACLGNSACYLLTAGETGILVCYRIQLPDEEISEQRLWEERMSEFDDMPLNENYVAVTFPPDGGTDNYWIDLQDKLHSVRERRKYEAEIKGIKEKFRQFQREVVQLLEQNLEQPVEERLDMSEFDLDTDTRNRRLHEAAAERERVKLSFQKTIKDCNDMSLFIIQECWKKMERKTRVLQGIQAHFEVESYGLLPDDVVLNETLKFKSLRKNTRMKLDNELNIDNFYPWIPKQMPVDQNDPSVKMIVKLPAKARTEEEEQRLAIQREFEYSGSSSYKYVTLHSKLKTQITFASALQSVTNCILFQEVVLDLKHFFNKKFDEMFKRKEYEMLSVLQRNNRLRVILFEMEHSCKRPSNEVVPNDPQWTFFEIPENIIQVQDSEVKSLPYVSPSEQKLIDERLAEEERIRLLLAADNFRELALIEMMDGVLEVRWEDELKREIEKPVCMLEKDPEEFNEQDLVAIRDYEEKCVERVAERERYYKMLEQEFKRVKIANTEAISIFDHDLHNLLLLKLNVESALFQEELKLLRIRRFNYKLFWIDLEEKEILKKRREREVEAKHFNELFENIKQTYHECKTSYEALVAKDKRMERALKIELNKANAMPAQIDHLMKVFMRRPKLVQQAPPFRALYEDLSQLVTSLSGRLHILKEYHVSDEFYEFFQALESLDLHSAAGPNIDENLWQKVVIARRRKIESEFKIKAAQCAMNDAEKTLNKFTNDISVELQAYEHEGAVEKICQLRKEKAEVQHNFQLQLILKQGQVEQNISGQISDFEECILINKYVIDTINALIQEAGKKKIEAMLACADFHRGIILKEWEHKKLKMEIEDLENEFHLVQTLKITNDIKQYLRRVALRGEPTMKELLMCDKESNEVKMIQHYHKKAMKELIEQMKVLEGKYDGAKRDSKKIDKDIESCNVAASAIHHHRSSAYEATEKEEDQRRMDLITTRSKLVKQIQKTRCEILQLQTELELIRLKTYPTLKYKSLI